MTATQNQKRSRQKKARKVYLAYTRNSLCQTPTLLRVYGSYDRAFDWLFAIAQRHDVRVRAGDDKTCALVVAPTTGQTWWIDGHDAE